MNVVFVIFEVYILTDANWFMNTLQRLATATSDRQYSDALWLLYCTYQIIIVLLLAQFLIFGILNTNHCYFLNFLHYMLYRSSWWG